MILPDERIEHLRTHPELAQQLEQWPIAFAGWVVRYPKQAAMIKQWLEVQPKICVVTGWKRCAKTFMGAYLGSCWLMGKLDKDWPGARLMGIDKNYSWTKRWAGDRVALIGGKTLEHVESVLLQEYRQLLPPSLVTEWFSRSKHQIRLGNKGRSVVRTYDQSTESWKSGAYQFIHLDEEPPHDVLMECLERTRTTSGKIIITVALDDADVSYLPEACRNPKKFFGTDDFLHFKLGVEDVPRTIYPESEKKIVFQQYDGTPLENAVRHGEFAYLSGRWWAEFDPKVHVIPPFPIPKAWPKWRCVDPGTAAPTACVWAAMHPVHNILFFYREYYRAGSTIPERCRDIVELSGNQRVKCGGIYEERETSEKYEMSVMDHAEFHVDPSNGDSLDFQYVINGLVCQPSTTLGQEARREMMRKWLWVDKREKHFITHESGAPRAYFFSTLENLIWEAQKKTFKRSTSDKSGTTERKIDNKDDHLMDTCEFLSSLLSYVVQDREMF